jgi:hypothetical protein
VIRPPRDLPTWLVLVSLSLCTHLAVAQRADDQALENAAIEIRNKNRTISAEVLNNDKSVIKAAYPDIKTHLTAKGFNNAEVTQAVIAGWKSARLAPTGAGLLNEHVFKAQVSRLGMLSIESEPRDATIEINSSRYEESTNTTAWLATGSYRIVLSKEGYYPAEERRTIVEGKNPPLTKTLKPRLK